MKHETEQKMLLHFLNLDYTQTWEEIENEVGYNFGDYAFQTLKPNDIMPMVRFMWASLHDKQVREK